MIHPLINKSSESATAEKKLESNPILLDSNSCRFTKVGVENCQFSISTQIFELLVVKYTKYDQFYLL